MGPVGLLVGPRGIKDMMSRNEDAGQACRLDSHRPPLPNIFHVNARSIIHKITTTWRYGRLPTSVTAA